MSATNRGAVRVLRDQYPTPSWCVDVLLDYLHLDGGLWFDPCAGAGSIIQAVMRPDVVWHANDIEDFHPELRAYADPELRPFVKRIMVGDFLKMKRAPRSYDVILTNPPYSLAAEFVEHALSMARTVVMLLRLNFLESAKRETFFHEVGIPNVYVLPQRPSFSLNRQGKRGTDATAYAWMEWNMEWRSVGTVRRLRLREHQNG